MTKDEASALELFIKDHDTRFLGKAMEDEAGSGVVLTMPDGKVSEPIRSVEEFRERYVTEATPTILAAWKKWRP